MMNMIREGLSECVSFIIFITMENGRKQRERCVMFCLKKEDGKMETMEQGYIENLPTK